MKVNQSDSEIQPTLCQKVRLTFSQHDLHGGGGREGGKEDRGRREGGSEQWKSSE